MLVASDRTLTLRVTYMVGSSSDVNDDSSRSLITDALYIWDLQL